MTDQKINDVTVEDADKKAIEAEKKASEANQTAAKDHTENAPKPKEGDK